MPKLKRPSYKMKKFAKAYIENGGNAIQAVLDSYNVNGRDSAKQLGYENLDNPMVQKEIKRLLDKAGLSLEKLTDYSEQFISKALEAKPSFSAGVSHVEHLYKLHDVHPSNKTASMKWSIKQNVANQDITQITQSINQLRDKMDRLLKS